MRPGLTAKADPKLTAARTPKVDSKVMAPLTAMAKQKPMAKQIPKAGSKSRAGLKGKAGPRLLSRRGMMRLPKVMAGPIAVVN